MEVFILETNMPKWTKSQVAELRKWMQDSGTSVEKLAELVGETPKRITDRLSMGKYETIPKSFLISLYDATSLECLSPTQELRQVQTAGTANENLIYAISDLESRLAKVRGMLQVQSQDTSYHPPAHLGKIRDTFYELVELLQDFKPASEKDIEGIKRLIPPQDAGYFVSFFGSLYSKSSFQQYLNLTSYTPIGGVRRKK